MRKLLAILSLFAIILSISYVFGSCRKKDQLNHLLSLQQVIPHGFPPPLYRFEDNPLTNDGFELGRKLFYDGRLSIDNAHPCSGCHEQRAAFGTYDHDRSHGVYNSHTLRNAPVLFNLAWSPLFHWDGAYTSLKDESEQPITGHVEMGESFQDVINRLEDDAEYRERFKIVFGSPVIRPEFIQKALAQFTGYLISYNSRYDQYKKGTAAFTAQETNGYQLFRANCSTCHPEPLFTDYSLRNIGLPVDTLLNDYGKMRVTGKKEDSLKFKVPSLRNIYISENYMHDGRFNTIGQVLNHYRTGVQQSATLDPLLKNGINLTTSQVNDIVTFLRTLTDSTFLSDPRFAQPQ